MSCLACKTSYAAPNNGNITDKIANGVITAIEDEVYASNGQGYYADVGQPDDEDISHRLPVYIKPTMYKGTGWIIYKFMPYGEVNRMFYVNKRGLVILHGNPHNGFPPTQPDRLTVYMGDEQLCALKHTWIKKHFVIRIPPSKKRLALAKKRQQMRLGNIGK